MAPGLALCSAARQGGNMYIPAPCTHQYVLYPTALHGEGTGPVEEGVITLQDPQLDIVW
jgi:hypothetical protein